MSSIINNNVLLSHLNAEGNRVLDFPITKPECVDGLDERIEDKSSFNVLDVGTLKDILSKEGDS